VAADCAHSAGVATCALPDLDPGAHAGAWISVTDCGVGLTVEQARRVFDRHGHGDGVPGGSGLGLHISRRIIEAHGGRMGVESVPGRGTSIFFDLPMIDASSTDTGP